jgi:PPOX class probable F420-dependent enzyme
MERQQLVEALSRHRLAVLSSIGPDGGPQSAVVGIGVSDRLEIVFDTLATSRKVRNMQRDPRVALVVGWDREITLQIEGTADFPQGDELARVRAVYFAAHPDGPTRLSWPGITHVRVRPAWIRYSDFNREPAEIIEWRGDGGVPG